MAGRIVKATARNAAELCPILRPADRAEVRASVGLPPELVLPDMVEAAQEAWAAYSAGGELLGLFGVDPVPFHPHAGVIWMLGSTSLASHSREFLREARIWVAFSNQRYPLLVNRADARNTLHLRWLQLLGFVLIREAPWGAEGRPFIEFARLKPCVSSPSLLRP